MEINFPKRKSKQQSDKGIFQFISWVSLLGITPFFVFIFFTQPCADDIFYHNYGLTKTTWEFLNHHYNTWTGRYFSNLMMAINPYSLTSDPKFYPVMTFIVVSLFLSCSFFFLWTTLKILNFKISVKEKLAVWLILLALFFHTMPRPADSLYWFAGSSSHLIALSFALLSLSLYFKSFTQSIPIQWLNYVAITVLSFCIAGSNETIMLQWIFILTFICFYEFYILKKVNFKILVPLTVTLIGFGIVFLAPGNKIRAQALNGGHDIVLLLFKPLGLIVETSIRYLSLNLIIVLFGVLPFLKRNYILIPDFLKSKSSSYLFFIFWLGLFFLTFVPSVWTMGGLPPRRVLNNTFFMILLLSALILLLQSQNWEWLYKLKTKWDQFFPQKIQKITFLLSYLFLFNHQQAWKDLINTPTYLSSQKERSNLIAIAQTKAMNPSSAQDTRDQRQDLILPPLRYFPSTYFYEDIRTDANDYRNLVFAEFYKLKSVKLSQDY